MEMNASTTVSPKEKKRWSDKTTGVFLTVCSAGCYTVSLSLMRAMTEYPEVSSDWSLAIKETVTCAVAALAIAYLRAKGKYKFPRWGVFWMLVGAGVTCELIGARSHLAAYAAIGLALATPLIQASQLILSSLFGLFWLKEGVSKSRLAALVLLLAAVWVLSSGVSGTDATIAGNSFKLGFGLLCAVGTAFGYSSQLSMMRRVLRNKKESDDGTTGTSDLYAPTSLVMITVCGVGVLIFGSFLTVQEGWSAWTAPPAECWVYVLLAGVANMVGFIFQIESLRRLYVLNQTMIANVQTLILVGSGVLFFGEPFSWTTAAGLALLVAGVALAGISKN